MYVGKCVILGDLCYSLVGTFSADQRVELKIATTVKIVRGTLLSLNFTFVSVLMNLSVIIQWNFYSWSTLNLEKCPSLEVSHQVTSINSVDCTFLVVNLWDHDLAKKKLCFELFKAVKKIVLKFCRLPYKVISADVDVVPLQKWLYLDCCTWTAL